MDTLSASPRQYGRQFKVFLSAFVCLFFLTLSAQATNLQVHCGGKYGITKISSALRIIDPAGPNTLTVSGTCKENVVIVGFDRLNLIANPGAVLTDASGGQQWAVLYIADSRRVSIQGFTISGGNVGVSCSDYSLCRFSGNTFTGTSQRGVDINNSEVSFSGDVIQNNLSQGIFAQNSHITGSYVTLNHNGSGAFIMWGSVVINNWNASNNAQDAIFIAATNFQLIDSNVFSNGWNGINATDLADVNLSNDTVTGNGYSGGLVGDTSIVGFNGGSYTGNGWAFGAPDISCGGHYALAKGIEGVYGTTDCPVANTAAMTTKAK